MSFNFQIVSLQGVEYNGHPSMILLPGESGQFAILEGHENYISKLKVGMISIYEGDIAIDRFVIRGGFVEVKDNICIALIDDIVNEKYVNFSDIELKLNSSLDEAETEYLKEVLKLNTRPI